MTPLPTYTGRCIDLDAPRAADIVIEDLAHHLAIEPRFNGATRVPYSVAQHSLLVSQVVPAEHALVALLHDAPEAYCKDLPLFLKRRIMREYGPIEARVWAAVCARFQLPLELPEAVKAADRRLAMTEVLELLTPSDWVSERIRELAELGVEPYPGPLYPIKWRQAEQLFLHRFRELTEPEGLQS